MANAIPVTKKATDPVVQPEVAPAGEPFVGPVNPQISTEQALAERPRGVPYKVGKAIRVDH